MNAIKKLNKTEREQLRLKYLGRCAYCGDPLGNRWHADHLEPVERVLQHVRGKGFVPTGEVWRPENNCLGNMMPSCPPCNIDKHKMSLEDWRTKLQNAAAVLGRNNPTYRHARRFGLIRETGDPVVFFFEKCALAAKNVQLAVCIGCGCTDLRACHDEKTGQPCHWLVVDYEVGKGVCSVCEEHLERWNAGNREVAI